MSDRQTYERDFSRNCILRKLPSTIISVVILTYFVDVSFTKVS